MIKFIRSILMVFVFGIFGIGSLVVGFIIFPVVNLFFKNKKEIYSKIIQNSWRIFLKLLINLKLIKLKIKDLEKIKNIKNSVIVSTHPSYIDVLIIIALIPKTTCFVAPKIIKNKFFKNIAKSMFLLSGKPLNEIIEDAKAAFDNGFNVLIFPMGTRHKQNEFPKIRKGAALIATKTKKDIAVIKMATDVAFLQIHEPFYKAGEKTVNYNISFVETIKTMDCIQKEKDKFELIKTITKKIKSALYS